MAAKLIIVAIRMPNAGRNVSLHGFLASSSDGNHQSLNAKYTSQALARIVITQMKINSLWRKLIANATHVPRR